MRKSFLEYEMRPLEKRRIPLNARDEEGALCEAQAKWRRLTQTMPWMHAAREYPREPTLVLEMQLPSRNRDRAILTQKTFNEFVLGELAGDPRIKNMPFFCSMLGSPRDCAQRQRWPSSFVRGNFPTFGDVPLVLFLRLTDDDLIRISFVGKKTLRVFDEILDDFGLVRVPPEPVYG
jgi:hypothetical protein